MKEGFIGIIIVLMISIGLLTMTLFRRTWIGLFFMGVGALLSFGLVKAAK